MAANALLRMLLCCVLLLVSGVSRARDTAAVESLLRADYSSVIIDGVRTPIGRHAGALSDVRPDDVRIELAVLNSGNIKEYLNRIDKVRGDLGGGLWRISFIGASGCDQPTVEVVAIVRNNDTGVSRLIPVIDREANPVKDRG